MYFYILSSFDCVIVCILNDFQHSNLEGEKAVNRYGDSLDASEKRKQKTKKSDSVERKSQSKRAGLQLPVGRIANILKVTTKILHTDHYAESLNSHR